MSQLYPLQRISTIFQWSLGEYSDFLTFKGGLNPVTGGLWLTDIAHHHLALSVLFIFAGHMYRTNWGGQYERNFRSS
jgi:photosystem I P700 chlorophyll a apoprotein A1